MGDHARITVIELSEITDASRDAVVELIVDERHQGRGIGRAIVEHVTELIRAEGATELLASHVIGEGGPDGLYERLGFVPTGEFDSNGERLLRLDLTSARPRR